MKPSKLLKPKLIATSVIFTVSFFNFFAASESLSFRIYSLGATLYKLLTGQTPPDANDVNEDGLPELLEGYEGVIMGISAGSMNLANPVYVQPEEPGESSPDFQRFAPGLGLTRYQILPHYQKVKDNYLDGQRLFEEITYKDSMGNTFLSQ